MIQEFLENYAQLRREITIRGKKLFVVNPFSDPMDAIKGFQLSEEFDKMYCKENKIPQGERYNASDLVSEEGKEPESEDAKKSLAVADKNNITNLTANGFRLYSKIQALLSLVGEDYEPAFTVDEIYKLSTSKRGITTAEIKTISDLVKEIQAEEKEAIDTEKNS